MQIEYHPIGIIHSSFNSIEDMPIQPSGAIGSMGSIEISPKYVPALKDLDGFSHIYLLYHFHQSISWKPMVTPFMDSKAHGLFSTRAPKRPNPIGLSVVSLRSVDGAILEIENVDILDGTPLLDIKPYVPEFDHYKVSASGWLEETAKNVRDKRSDLRFK